MVDVVIDSAAHANQPRGMRTIVFTTGSIGYFFFIDGDGDFFYSKTTNGGLTWGTGVAIDTGEVTVHAFDVWYDQWTPGNTDRGIHLWWFGITVDDVFYNRLNTTNDSLAGDVTVVALASSTSARGSFVSGARMRGGNLLCAFDIDAGAEKGMYRSVDNGATWAAMTDPIEATIDQCKLFPANLADPNDAWLLYQDASTDELTIKTYDDSGNSFAESAEIGTAMAENITNATGQYGFDGSIRHSDGHLIVAFMDVYDSAGASDFLVYDWDGTTATALTNIATDTDDIYYPSVFLNQDQPDWIYVAYLGLTSGAEALGTGVGVYYALSKDRGLTWTKDIAYSTSVTDYRQTWTPSNGERFMVAWMDISSLGILTNHDNSKEFGFTTLNNYQSARSVSAGIMSVGERIR